MASKSKVFGIGFQKTGTSSLATALYILGYNVTGFFGVHDPEISQKVYQLAYDLADRFDAAQDTPWPVLYKQLDRRYPGSKFILTVRPTHKWINSVVKHFKNHYISAHEWIYGVKTVRGNENAYINRYERHNREVLEYFKDRSQDLLVMQVTEGDGWEKLCPFLDKPLPPLDFPVQNTSQQRSRQIIQRGVRFIKRKLTLNKNPRQDSQMAQGVSATFVRDILHYHYSMFEQLWTGVLTLSEPVFAQPDHHASCSVRDLLMRQLLEEHTWLECLKGKTSVTKLALLSSKNQTKEAVYDVWNHQELCLRAHAANLSDDDCNARVPGRNEYVWEVFVHLLTGGTERRAQLCGILRHYGSDVETPSFINFFR